MYCFSQFVVRKIASLAILNTAPLLCYRFLQNIRSPSWVRTNKCLVCLPLKHLVYICLLFFSCDAEGCVTSEFASPPLRFRNFRYGVAVGHVFPARSKSPDTGGHRQAAAMHRPVVSGRLLCDDAKPNLRIVRCQFFFGFSLDFSL